MKRKLHASVALFTEPPKSCRQRELTRHLKTLCTRLTKKQLNRLRRAYDVLCALECETEKKYRACARESLPQSSHLMRTSVERSSAQHTTKS